MKDRKIILIDGEDKSENIESLQSIRYKGSSTLKFILKIMSNLIATMCRELRC